MKDKALATADQPFTVARISAPNHLRLGEYCAAFGGIFAGQIKGEPGLPDYYLFAARKDTVGDNRSITFGSRGINEPDAEHAHDGLANTLALVNSKNDHPAAHWARGLEIDGFKDFYVPSREELRLCFINCRDDFEADWYGTSTQFGSDNAWYQYFGNGNQSIFHKDWKQRCHAVRRVIIDSSL